MIKSFTITNHFGDSIKLELTRPEDTGLLITSVTGLGPVKAEIGKTEMAIIDGVDISNVRLSARNIVFSITFYEGNTERLSVEDIRHRCYKYFPVKKEITIQVENDHGKFSISGVVETNDPPIFSKTEGSQISIICEDPYFVKDDVDYEFRVSNIDYLFEFPVSFEAEELTDDCYEIVDNGFGGKDLVAKMLYVESENSGVIETAIEGSPFVLPYSGKQIVATRNKGMIEFSRVKNYPSTIINYLGSGESGVVIVVDANGPITNLRINNVTRGESIIFDDTKLQAVIGSTIKKYDQIVINTEKGQKSCTLIRNGCTYNIMHAVAKNTKWIYLQNGENVITYSSGLNISDVSITVTCVAKYNGV